MKMTMKELTNTLFDIMKKHPEIENMDFDGATTTDTLDDMLPHCFDEEDYINELKLTCSKYDDDERKNIAITIGQKNKIDISVTNHLKI